MKCSLCDGSGWTDNPENTHLSRWECFYRQRYPDARRLYNIPEGTPPLPCLICNKTQLGPNPSSTWIPYFPRWEVGPDDDRTSSDEWKDNPRNRLGIFYGKPCKVAPDGTLIRVR